MTSLHRPDRRHPSVTSLQTGTLNSKPTELLYAEVNAAFKKGDFKSAMSLLEIPSRANGLGGVFWGLTLGLAHLAFDPSKRGKQSAKRLVLNAASITDKIGGNAPPSLLAYKMLCLRLVGEADTAPASSHQLMQGLPPDSIKQILSLLMNSKKFNREINGGCSDKRAKILLAWAGMAYGKKERQSWISERLLEMPKKLIESGLMKREEVISFLAKKGHTALLARFQK